MSTTAREIAAWSINADAHSLIHLSSFLPVLVGEGVEEEEEGIIILLLTQGEWEWLDATEDYVPWG